MRRWPALAVDNGRRLGVDVGSVRVGVALSDPGGVLATPLVTLDHDESAGADLARLVALVDEHEVVEVVVGLPRTLAGREGPAAQKAQDYAAALRGRLSAAGRDVPVVLADERLTTVTAMRTLSDRGVKGRKQRKVIDQAAAVGILQGYLDARRARPAGGATAEDT
ncbi:Holliday junction resolvase RuvX [Actinomycetospora chibensis]|uniref:Putative pre-16S rRNA nuclease n=1 Tax=Actinomycetospora chibensis TaxID=663606 RepID=A0ABV9RG40_9PSEU|nr:Holliday junction resolvase RuvX [Actinomycetospora chibensis]MDD7922002.1 Holliday junction resolvase RuvX [Actinomycetospora chibensis]